MVGVYIKGMEMPGSCGECGFLNPGNYKGKEYPCVCDVGDFLVKPSETDLRDGLCPLVEVPDHGDLIDRDALIESFHVSRELCMKWANEAEGHDEESFLRAEQTHATFVEAILRTKAQEAIIPADKEEA